MTIKLDNLDELIHTLQSEDKFLITTHEHPDPDGLGSQIGLAYILKHWGKDTIILNQDPPPVQYNTCRQTMYDLRENKPVKIKDIKDRIAILVDANIPSRMGKVLDLISEQNLIIIDHHEISKKNRKKDFIYPHMGACCEIIYLIMQAINLTPPRSIAEALYRGIILDTGHFRYSKTTSTTHEIVAQLIKIGVSPTDISEELKARWSYKRLLARQILYKNLEFTPCHRIAWFSISYQEIQNLAANDANIFEDIVLDLFEARSFYIALLFSERDRNYIRVSLRSRSGVNVLPVVMAKNGGGHANACGIRMQKPLNEAIQEVISDLLSHPQIIADMEEKSKKIKALRHRAKNK